jgi:hypothetical protein
MTITYKVLGQASPAQNTLVDLYTVPTGNSAVVSTITVCNQNTINVVFRIAVRPGNAAVESKHYISYDTALPALDSIALTLGITLAATDVVGVLATSANVSFNIYGSEIY